jgi:uncharacterized protein (DUF2062 family)
MWRQRFLATERRALSSVIRFFRLRHTTEQIARGFAVGLTPNFFPTFGFGFLLSALLARLVGGNAAAGIVGGLVLTFFWPLLFFLNMQTGSFFINPRILIADLDDVTEKNIEALLWGPAFTVGAAVNCLIAGFVSYVLVVLFYHRARPGALAFFRRHAQRRPRPFRRLFRRERSPAPARRNQKNGQRNEDGAATLAAKNWEHYSGGKPR